MHPSGPVCRGLASAAAKNTQSKAGLAPRALSCHSTAAVHRQQLARMAFSRCATVAAVQPCPPCPPRPHAPQILNIPVETYVDCSNGPLPIINARLCINSHQKSPGSVILLLVHSSALSPLFMLARHTTSSQHYLLTCPGGSSTVDFGAPWRQGGTSWVWRGAAREGCKRRFLLLPDFRGRQACRWSTGRSELPLLWPGPGSKFEVGTVVHESARRRRRS